MQQRSRLGASGASALSQYDGAAGTLDAESDTATQSPMSQALVPVLNRMMILRRDLLS
jgi:hypothetical protein